MTDREEPVTRENLESRLVAWCRECQCYLPEDEIGDSCPGDCNRTLVKRRGWICPNCEHVFFGKRPEVCYECNY